MSSHRSERCSFRPRVEGLEDRLAPATFTVTSTADVGAGSLRRAIGLANSTAGADVINFLVGNGAQKINLTAALPTITETVTIDATTQPGFTSAPLIVLNGAAAGVSVSGLTIDGASANNCVIKGFVIRSFSGNGIVIGSDGNTVQTCFIGTNGGGTAAASNGGTGVVLQNDAANNTIGGTSAAVRNLISGNRAHGLLLNGTGVTGNTVRGNYIGANLAGTIAIPNARDGVVIAGGAHANTLGGAGGGNFIAGNGRFGVNVSGTGTTGNIIATNSIAVNSSSGIQLAAGAATNTIGGLAVGLGNVISSNGVHGILMTGSDVTGNLVQGNFIGTNGTGTAALKNNRDGVVLAGGAHGNTIGGAGGTNLISGNGRFGVNISGAGTTGNTVAANLIGLDVNSGAVVANASGGIQVADGADGNTLGGTATGTNNIISGNGRHGILISRADGTMIQGNRIGTKLDGTGTFGNAGHGIFVTNTSANTMIGGTAAGAANVIANNTGNGVLIGSDVAAGFSVAAGAGNAVLGNSIFANTRLGIDLGANNGVSPNDPLDGDGGPNNWQNFATVTAATLFNTGTQVQVTVALASLPNTTFRVEIFASTAADPSGSGEGHTYLGFANVTTDASGNGTAIATVAIAAANGTRITLTATNSVTNDTSEFSPARTAV